jgi:SAM-dependent methyltransferase
MSSPVLSPSRAEVFAGRMLTVLNDAALALMLSSGHRTGLFDALARLGRPAGSPEIAEAAGLSERYVREWLGAMVTGGVVEYDPAGRTYLLPPEHAACLTRGAGANMAASAQWVAVLGHVEDHVVEAFRHGRGVPYDAYHRFHEVMAEESAQTVVAALHAHIVPLVPGLAERLAAGIDVLDVGCGSGRALAELAARYPASRFTGYDLCPEAVAAARAGAAGRGLANVRFEAADVAAMAHAGTFDLVTAFDAIHDQARPDAVLRAVARALRRGGTFLMQEIAGTGRLERDAAHPAGTFLYAVSCMHCMSVSLANGGPGLGAMWGRERALAMLADAGFGRVRVEELPHDVMNLYYVVDAPGG